MYNDVMVDIETAGRGDNALVLAIGAVQFHAYLDNIGEGFEVIFDPLDAERTGGEISMSTMIWWLQQDTEVRTRMFGGTTGVRQGLRDFNLWYRSIDPARVWANGTTFDINILQHLYERMKIKPPWHYRDVRDMRFIRDITNENFQYKLQLVYECNRAPHDALFDARTQARAVQLAYDHLGWGV